MEHTPSSIHMQPEMAEINEKYAKIIDKGNQFVLQNQKFQKDDGMFRTQSFEKFQGVNQVEPTPIGGNLFISGSSAPVCAVKERKALPKKYRAPLPKTRRNKMPKTSIPPLQGFGCTNMR